MKLEDYEKIFEFAAIVYSTSNDPAMKRRAIEVMATIGDWGGQLFSGSGDLWIEGYGRVKLDDVALDYLFHRGTD